MPISQVVVLSRREAGLCPVALSSSVCKTCTIELVPVFVKGRKLDLTGEIGWLFSD